jgi:hypothetical protein
LAYGKGEAPFGGDGIGRMYLPVYIHVPENLADVDRAVAVGRRDLGAGHEHRESFRSGGDRSMVSRPARLAVLLVVLGLTGGCTSDASGTSATAPTAPVAVATPSASPIDSRTPLQRLKAGIPTEESSIYHFSIKSSDRPINGVIDPPDKIAEFTTIMHFTRPSYTETMTTLLTKNKSWLKVKYTPTTLSGLPHVPKKWMSLDPKKIKLKNGTPFVYVAESDPGYTNTVFDNVSDLTETSPGHFRGITDLSSTGADQILSAARLKALGKKAVNVTFTAVLDGDGRLTTTSLRFPTAGKFKAGTDVITYDEYGTAAVPKLPTAAEQTKAPSFVYEWFR